MKEKSKGLGAQIESMREEVMQQELSARSWKAYFDKMFYTIEAEKLEDEYQAVQAKLAEKLKAQQEAQVELMKTLRTAVDESIPTKETV